MFTFVIHNIHNVQRLMDISRMFLGLNVIKDKLLVISKATGPAALDGVPEVHKLAYKLNCRVMIVPDIKDLLELIRYDRVYLIVTSEGVDVSRLVEEIKEGKNVVVVVSGQDTGFTRQELVYGEPLRVTLPIENPPPTALAAIVLYEVYRGVQS